jgi:xylulokinase
MSLMGIDLGTTGVKAVCFKPDGTILSSAYREYPTHSPRPGWMELDPERVWRDAAEAIAEASGKCKDPVTALGISCLGEAIAQVDKKGKLVYPTIVGFDNRARHLAADWLKTQNRLRLMEITGIPPSQLYTIFKLMWLKHCKPGLYSRIDKVLCYEDWAIYKMGLEPAVDYSTAARTMAFDIRTKTWSREVCDAAGLRTDYWAKPVPGGTLVGELGREAARKLRLPVGCKVATGAHDQSAGAVGAGAIKGGYAMDATGTVECIALAVKRQIASEIMLENNFGCYPHAVPDTFITLGFNSTGGSLLRWFRDTLAGEEKAQAKKERRDVYEILMEEMSDEPSSIFVLPHFTAAGTPYMDPKPTGAIVGLTLSTTKPQLIRAVVEGITYEMKLNLFLMEKAGIEVEELRAIGGGAKSEKWLQLKADMFDRPVVRLAVSEAVCLGGAICAGVATGVYSSYEQATDLVVKKEKQFTPNRKRAAYYDERLAAYREIYPALKRVQGKLPEEE